MIVNLSTKIPEVEFGSLICLNGKKELREEISEQVFQLVVENLISIPSIQQLYPSLIFDKG